MNNENLLHGIHKCTEHHSLQQQQTKCDCPVSVQVDSLIFGYFIESAQLIKEEVRLRLHLNPHLRGVCVYIREATVDFLVAKIKRSHPQWQSAGLLRRHPFLMGAYRRMFAVENIDTYQHWGGHTLRDTFRQENEDIRAIILEVDHQANVSCASRRFPAPQHQQNTLAISEDLVYKILESAIDPCTRLKFAQTCKLFNDYVVLLSKRELPARMQRVLSLYAHNEKLALSIRRFVSPEKGVLVQKKLAVLYKYDRDMSSLYRAVSWNGFQQIYQCVAIPCDSYAVHFMRYIKTYGGDYHVPNAGTACTEGQLETLYTSGNQQYVLTPVETYRYTCTLRLSVCCGHYWRYLRTHRPVTNACSLPTGPDVYSDSDSDSDSDDEKRDTKKVYPCSYYGHSMLNVFVAGNECPGPPLRGTPEFIASESFCQTCTDLYTSPPSVTPQTVSNNNNNNNNKNANPLAWLWQMIRCATTSK